MGDQPDLHLAETAPMHVDAGVFDGMLDYAVSDDAHDVDDSIVPPDAPTTDDDADGDADAADFLDDIALHDNADDPLEDAPADGDADADVTDADAAGADLGFDATDPAEPYSTDLDAGITGPYPGLDDIAFDDPGASPDPADYGIGDLGGGVGGGPASESTDDATDPGLKW